MDYTAPAPSTWTFPAVFAAVADHAPDRTALRHGSHGVTWAEFTNRTARLASALRAAGLTDGDVVAELLGNRPEYMETLIAAIRAGLVPMNTNYRYTGNELLEVWQDADARAVVYGAAYADRVAEVRDRMPGVRAWIEVGPAYEAAIATHEPWSGIGDPDGLILLYTGGTTGRPKGVMWRQADLLSLLSSVSGRPVPDRAPAAAVAEAVATRRPGVVTVIASPLMHGAGLFSALSELTAVTLPGTRYEPERLLDTLERTAAKSLAIVGDAFARPSLAALDDAPARWDLDALRVISSTGAMWSSPVKEGLLRHLPRCRMIDGLGSSEASAIGATHSTPGDVGETASFTPSNRAAVLLDDGTLARPGDGPHRTARGDRMASAGEPQ